jgi:photosystem II stability/assembly factor-like uncharacterized protein
MSVDGSGLNGLGPEAFEDVDPELRERVRSRAFARGHQIRRRQTAIRRGATVAAAVVVVGGGVLIARSATSNTSEKALGTSTTTSVPVSTTASVPVTSTTAPSHPSTTVTTLPNGGTTVPPTTVVPPTTTIKQPTTTTQVSGSTTTLPPSWAFQTAPAGQGQLNALSCGGPAFCVAASTGTGSTTVLVTTNLGANWVVSQLPADVISVSCGDPTHCVIAAAAGSAATPVFLVTSDAGGSWSKVAAPTKLTNLQSVSCWDGSNCVAVGDVSSKPGAFVTDDGGQTWTDTGTLPPGIGEPLTVECPGSSTCYAGGGAQIGRSDDGGQTWHIVTAPTGVSNVASLSCPTSTYCVVGGGDAIAVSSDGGVSWSAATLPAGVTGVSKVDCTSTSSCWAGGTAMSSTGPGSTGVVLQSSNGGLAWSTAAEAPGATFGAVVCFPSGCVGVGAGYTGTHPGP